MPEPMQYWMVNVSDLSGILKSELRKVPAFHHEMGQRILLNAEMVVHEVVEQTSW
jgi:hypothetical protein